MKSILLIFCALFMAACASDKVFMDQFDHGKTWVEQQAQLPDFPNQESLILFDAGPTSNDRHYIDANSIQVGQDGVIRYSLIVKTSAGASNITFEGIRCDKNERKIYALGRNDKTWVQPRHSEWQRMENIRQFDIQKELARYYFCPLKSIVKTPQEAINALKTGMHPRVRSLY